MANSVLRDSVMQPSMSPSWNKADTNYDYEGGVSQGSTQFIPDTQMTVPNSRVQMRSALSCAGIQPSLEIGAVDDPLEREADKVADQVVNRNGGTGQVLFHPSPAAEHITPLQLKSEEEEEEPVQMQTEQKKTETGAEVPADFESSLNSSKSGGNPLQGDLRSQMESGFGTDFSDVRVHTGADAVQMSNQVGAQAFTHGNNIYFNEGKFDPESKSGQHLIAHELTHTIQQGASLQRKRIQREESNAQPATTSADTPKTTFNLPDGTIIDTLNKKMLLPEIMLPKFKERNEAKFSFYMILRQGKRGNTKQGETWKKELRPSVIKQVDKVLKDAGTQFNYEQKSDTVFFLKPASFNKPLRVFGNKETLIESFLIPFWDRKAEPATFQVDHILEDQLGGEDNIDNYELLDASANMSSGRNIQINIEKNLKDAIEKFMDNDKFMVAFGIIEEDEKKEKKKKKSDINTIFTKLKEKYTIVFSDIVFTENLKVNGDPNVYWSLSEVLKNEHINMLQIMSPAEMLQEGLNGMNPENLMIFTGSSGGHPSSIPWGKESGIEHGMNGIKLFNNDRIKLQSAKFEPFTSGNVGYLIVQANYADGSPIKVEDDTNLIWFLNAISGLKYGGAIDETSVTKSAKSSLLLPGMSPIEIHSAYLDSNQGIMATGKVLPTVPFIKDADIDIVIEGDNVRLRKIFNSGELDLPAPFYISDTSLEVFIGTQGLGINGQVNFGIDHVGEGHIGAAASTSGGFELEGAFNFDSELFDPANISVEYKNNVWKIGGTIGIPEGKIKGVKSATITATYSENNFTASGEAELDIPGIQQGTMNATYNDKGFSIGGSFKLKDDIPGIKGGNVSATIAKQDGADGYQVTVSGTAQPKIPGINSTLSVMYDNGALTIEGSADYNRGMLGGTVKIGATNRSIGDDGQPTGDPGQTMRVYGGGSLTLTLTPWLQAKAGVNFLPNGELEVTGRIGLPGTVNVFDRKSINRKLFTVPAVEIPIFAIPLGPKSIGVVARITGGLDFSAGFGPGQLQELYGEVTYNPDREEETTIAGHGKFVIPANAGLTLRGDLGLGVSVAIASLTGGIEIAGTLGLDGEAAAEIDVNWNPQTGLALDATGKITVNPKFTFDINAFARANLDLLVTSVDKTWRYNLASFSWGPDIQFGIIFLIHYKEGEPFDVSFDDLQVIYPKLDVVDMAKGLARDVKDKIFN